MIMIFGLLKRNRSIKNKVSIVDQYHKVWQMIWFVRILIEDKFYEQIED